MSSSESHYAYIIAQKKIFSFSFVEFTFLNHALSDKNSIAFPFVWKMGHYLIHEPHLIL